MTKKIAFLGAGRMGRGMITNLYRAGHQVSVYNRSRDPLTALADMGIQYECVDTPAQAAEGADFIMSMVTDDNASLALWEGPAGALHARTAPNAIAIESSTVSASRIESLSKSVLERGLAFLDCPVAGRPEAALAGTLTVFAGGATDVLERARPVLTAISRQILHFGSIGSGITFKLLYNGVGATQVASLAEAMAACRNAGLDLEVASQAFSEGATGSNHVKLHAKIMATGNYTEEPGFTPSGRIKDLDYVRALMKHLGVETGVVDAARAAFASVDPALQSVINDTQIVDFLGTRTSRLIHPESGKPSPNSASAHRSTRNQD